MQQSESKNVQGRVLHSSPVRSRQPSYINRRRRFTEAKYWKKFLTKPAKFNMMALWQVAAWRRESQRHCRTERINSHHSDKEAHKLKFGLKRKHRQARKPILAGETGWNASQHTIGDTVEPRTAATEHGTEGRGGKGSIAVGGRCSLGMMGLRAGGLEEERGMWDGGKKIGQVRAKLFVFPTTALCLVTARAATACEKARPLCWHHWNVSTKTPQWGAMQSWMSSERPPPTLLPLHSLFALQSSVFTLQHASTDVSFLTDSCAGHAIYSYPCMFYACIIL